jgi:glycosyltransferase involved in cell wall biosynthesis
MQPLVSIIVPVYKVEDCLARCLESLIKQSMNNIEIILVNDASPDRCGIICNAYADIDARVKVINHLVNRGLSVARNTGIANATSDYLMFVDSDDYVHKDFCKLPYECAVQYQADLVMFGYQKNDILQVPVVQVYSVASGNKTREEAVDLTFKPYGMVAWNKLYKKDLFKEIMYPEGVLYEDTATTYKLICKAKSIFCLDEVLYYYCARPNSITLKKQTLKTVKDRFVACWQQSMDLLTWGYNSTSLETYMFNVTFDYCIKMKADYSDEYYVEAVHFLKNVQKIPIGITWKRKLLLSILKFSPKLFSIICWFWGSQIK